MQLDTSIFGLLITLVSLLVAGVVYTVSLKGEINTLKVRVDNADLLINNLTTSGDKLQTDSNQMQRALAVINEKQDKSNLLFEKMDKKIDELIRDLNHKTK